MNLTIDEGKLFYDLYAALLSFVNRKLTVSSEQFTDSREYTSTPPQARVAIRDALFAHRELIDEFVRGNPANLKADDLEIVGLWKHALPGKFYVFRYLKKYTVFLTSGGSPNKAYGVLGLADPLEEVIGPHLPNPMVWMLEVNGFLLDIRSAPRELQEVAFRKGLIPYLPADRAKSDGDTTALSCG